MHRRFARCGRMPAFPLFPPVAGLPAGTARDTMNPVVPGAPFGFLRWSAAVAKEAGAAGGPDVGRMFYGNRLSTRSLVSPRHEGHPRFRRGRLASPAPGFGAFQVGPGEETLRSKGRGENQGVVPFIPSSHGIAPFPAGRSAISPPAQASKRKGLPRGSGAARFVQRLRRHAKTPEMLYGRKWPQSPIPALWGIETTMGRNALLAIPLTATKGAQGLDRKEKQYAGQIPQSRPPHLNIPDLCGILQLSPIPASASANGIPSIAARGYLFVQCRRIHRCH